MNLFSYDRKTETAKITCSGKSAMAKCIRGHAPKSAMAMP